jgi:catechol 2,3-dioxygenase-like lactoylglutathione lyase family enzyme
MFETSKAFSGFSVNDLDAAKKFYGETLGLDVADEMAGIMRLNLSGGSTVIAYEKPNHIPASFTVLNFPVENIDAAVVELRTKGVQFERFDGFDQDEKGIARPKSREEGPPIAWFKDPAGNILAVLEQ